MLPIISIFGKELSTYTLCVLVGALLGGWFVCHQAKKHGRNDNDYIIFLLVCGVGALIGSHLLYGITKFNLIVKLLSDWSRYVTSFQTFFQCMLEIFGGAVFYGGLIGAVAAGCIYGRIKKLDMREYSDICAPMTPLFHMFGRIGCFLGGCCYGIESSFGFITYSNELNPSINGVRRFPVQLLESACNLIIFLILWYLLKKGVMKGRLFALYVLIYSTVRFFDEFLRGDAYRGFLFGLSTSQIISLALFVCAVLYLILKRKRGLNKVEIKKE